MNLLNEIARMESNPLARQHRACTPCCPFTAENRAHPQFTSAAARTDASVHGGASNADTCCLSQLRVNCRVQSKKKKKKKKAGKRMKNKRFSSVHSSQASKRSLSSSSQISSDRRKRHRLGSSTNTNYHNYDFVDNDSTVSSSSSSTSSTGSTSDDSQLLDRSTSSETSFRSPQRRIARKTFSASSTCCCRVSPRKYQLPFELLAPTHESEH